MTLKLLGAVPWIVMLGGMPFVNRTEPLIFGLPLPLAWAVGCTLLSALVLFAIYRLDPENRT